VSAQAQREAPQARVSLPVLERPRTRAECADGPRPCPWVSCRHHLYGYVDAVGHYRVAKPWLHPWELAESCSLDVAEQGGLDDHETAAVSGVDRADVNRMAHQFVDKVAKISEAD